jgi:hypothetical protein
MAEVSWWYEWEGRQAGPIADAALRELVRSGRLRPEARVWRAGLAGWESVRALPELAAELPGSPPSWSSAPAPGTPPPAAPGTPPREAAPAAAAPALGSGWSPSPGEVEGMEPVSTGAVVGLGLLTLGIYPAVKFYQAVQAYQTLAGRSSRFASYFWLGLGLWLLGGPVYALGGFLGFSAHVAALAFTILALFEALALRGEAVRRHGVAVPLTSDATHKALFVTGLFTWWFFVGFVLFAVQAVKFFDDHRALGDALRARRPGAAAVAVG